MKTFVNFIYWIFCSPGPNDDKVSLYDRTLAGVRPFVCACVVCPHFQILKEYLRYLWDDRMQSKIGESCTWFWERSDENSIMEKTVSRPFLGVFFFFFNQSFSEDIHVISNEFEIGSNRTIDS